MNKGALPNPPRTEGLAFPLLLAPPSPPAVVFGLLISMCGCGSSLRSTKTVFFDFGLFCLKLTGTSEASQPLGSSVALL